MNEFNYIQLGKSNKPHGIKGGFLFHLFNQQDSVLKKNIKIQIRPLDGSSLEGAQEVEIDRIQFGNKTIAYLKGISDRNQVEAMLPFEIWVDRELFPETKEGEFYLSDIIGKKTTDEDGIEGEIISCYDNGAQNVFVIQLDGGQKIDLPFTHQFFPNFDPSNEQIEIVIPEYDE
jgi:16S rRNA processing protein RimM